MEAEIWRTITLITPTHMSKLCIMNLIAFVGHPFIHKCEEEFVGTHVYGDWRSSFEYFANARDVLHLPNNRDVRAARQIWTSFPAEELT